jgi:hypothetical protein
MAKRNGALKLNADKVVQTLDHLRARVAERFPASGLAEVCAQLTATARVTAQRARRLSRPYLGLRALVAAIVLAAIGLEATLVGRLDWVDSLSKANTLNLAQGLERWSTCCCSRPPPSGSWSRWNRDGNARGSRRPCMSCARSPT